MKQLFIPSAIVLSSALCLGSLSLYAQWDAFGGGNSSGSSNDGSKGNSKSKQKTKKKKGNKGTKPAKGEPAKYAGMVAAHNAWRKKYKLPGLSWDNKVAAYAQNWANSLKKQGCKMKHRNPNKYGENLFWSSGYNPTTKQIVDAWGNEVKDYNYKNNSCKPGKMCGHYTQVVWKKTKKVGCGMAKCGSAQIWVCNYDPPGNYVGQKPY